MVPHGHPRRLTYSDTVHAGYSPAFDPENSDLRDRPCATTQLEQLVDNTAPRIGRDGRIALVVPHAGRSYRTDCGVCRKSVGVELFVRLL